MLISNGTALNILLANNNKLLNDALKETDNKTLNNISKQDKDVLSKTIDTGKILKEVFDSIKDSTKSNSTLENILKNSNLSKDLGNVSTNVSNLLDNIKDDENLQKFKPMLENFLKNFKDMKPDTLKEQIKNSGLFLENKLSQNSSITAKIESTLQNISNLIKNIDNPQIKEINNLINSIVKDISNVNSIPNKDLQSNLKTLTSSLQSLNNSLNNPITQNLNTLTSELKSLINQGTLVESKLENNLVKNQTTNTQMPSTQIKTIDTSINLNNNQIQNQLSSTQNLNTLTSELKSLINQGTLIESKIENNLVQNQTTNNNTNTAKIESTLQNISNLIKNIDSPQIKEINNLINSIVKDISNVNSIPNKDLQSNLKTFTSSLQNLNNSLNNPITQNLNTLTSELKSLINQGTLIESKIENNLVQNQTTNNNTNTAKIESTLQNISNLIKNIDSPQIKEINNLMNSIVKDISNVNSIPNKDLQSNLKTLTSSLQNLNNSLNNPITQNLNTLDIKDTINAQVKELLVQIRSDIIQNPNIVQNKNILPMIDNLLKTDDLFLKPEIAKNTTQTLQNNSNLTNTFNINLLTFTNNFETNLNPIVSALKNSLLSINPQNSQIQEHISSLVKKLETFIQEQVNNPKQNLKLEDDFKAVLLKMQDELVNKTDIKSQENLRTINNLITQIDYHQLTSVVSNSNYIYIPFFWEMLEDGTIEMKQKSEDKFFCQINLTLKDFGKVYLMLSLYDENRLDMTIYAQREHFKVAIRDNVQKLKRALNDVDLIPVNIKLLDMKDENLKNEKPSNIYQQNYYDELFNSRVDIKA